MIRSGTVMVLVAVLGSLTSVAGAKQDNATPKRDPLRTVGTLTGTVVTGIVTAGGDCPHKYWLRTDPLPNSGNSSLIALEPESRTLALYLNKKVKLQGSPKMCHGVEIDVVVFVISHISPAGAVMSDKTGTCKDWSAVHDLMPPKPGKLTLSGKCTFPTPGFRVTFKKAQPQGFNPNILILEKQVTPPTKPEPEVITTIPVGYEEITETRYKQIQIQPDGTTVDVKEVH